MIKLYMEQGSESWHDVRKGRFTASVFSSVVAGKSTASYKDLISNIAGQIISGETEETFVNATMERGTLLEPQARKVYEDTLEVKVQEVGFILPENEFSEWVGASPDGFTFSNGSEGGLEMKCPYMKTHLNYILANKLPNAYKWQVQGSLFVSGLEWWDFMSYYPNMKPFIIRVYPDTEMFTTLETRLKEAIEDVKTLIKNYELYDHS